MMHKSAQVENSRSGIGHMRDRAENRDGYGLRKAGAGA
jgi:hypothetical protein